MTESQRIAGTNHDLAALIKMGQEQARRDYTPPEPVLDLAPCICGTDEPPDRYRVFVCDDHHCVECDCGRYVGAKSKVEAIALWNRGANADAERKAWQREAAALLAGVNDLREELLDQISGYDEDRGRDQMIGGFIRMCDAVIAKGTKC